MFRGCVLVPSQRLDFELTVRRHGRERLKALAPLAPALAHLLPWQRYLFRKRSSPLI